MPELGITLPRNSALTRVAAALVLLASLAAAQTTNTNQGAPNAQTPQAEPPQNSAPAQPANQAPAQGQPAANQPATNQPAGQSANAPGGQANQGQAPVGEDNGGFVFRAESREVVLHATVVDDKNRLVTTLSKPDFTVFEDDKPQQIRHFQREDLPVAVGIVIDNSGSMREKRDAVNKAALDLVKASNPDDQVFVVNFNDEYYLDQPFTGDLKKLQDALEHVEARGGTALYDAIVASADYLKESKLQRKVLFVVTDGEDDASQESLEEAIHRLEAENGPVVYCIGLLGEERSRRAKRALELIAERTGGEAFFPPTLDQVDDISKNIAHDIRNQYTITYAPTTPKSVGGFRTIHVDAHAKPYKKLIVRTRTGYYPGQETLGAGGEN
ncbi:MAG TPA: VWA domain-containing protein [Terriglobales bacterium]|nr:VWA domain-containing protein [Terriglobales bacterium]